MKKLVINFKKTGTVLFHNFYVKNKLIRNILIILIIYNAYLYTNFYLGIFKNKNIQKLFDFENLREPQKGDTVLVIAPHPDDEVLGPGGISEML